LVVRNKLPRKDCLKSRNEIDQLFSTGQRFSGPGHTCVWSEADRFSYAVFVSRRHGPAVVRNRIKRRYREVIRQVRALVDRPVKVGFIPNYYSAKSSFQQVYGEIQRTFEQISRSQS
jgi:ribonuclease P protein component